MVRSINLNKCADTLVSSRGTPHLCGEGPLPQLLQPVGQQFPFPQVLRHCDGASDFFARLSEPAHLHQQVATHAGEEMVAGQRSIAGESGGCVERVESSSWTLSHADGDRAIECHDWRWIDLQQGVVEKDD